MRPTVCDRCGEALNGSICCRKCGNPTKERADSGGLARLTAIRSADPDATPTPPPAVPSLAEAAREIVANCENRQGEPFVGYVRRTLRAALSAHESTDPTAEAWDQDGTVGNALLFLNWVVMYHGKELLFGGEGETVGQVAFYHAEALRASRDTYDSAVPAFIDSLGDGYFDQTELRAKWEARR